MKVVSSRKTDVDGNEIVYVPTEHGELLNLPTRQLLDKLGAGSHKPGSGSAAALLTLVACKLLQTVISLTNDRSQYGEVRDQLTLEGQEITEDSEPKLVQLLQADSLQFNKVIQERQARDAASPGSRKKRRHRDKALSELRKATEIPLDIAEASIEVTKKAMVVFDFGFRSARGDSGVAINAAIAGAKGALSIVYLNLASFREGEWAISVRKKADEFLNVIEKLERDSMIRIARLQNHQDGPETDAQQQKKADQVENLTTEPDKAELAAG